MRLILNEDIFAEIEGKLNKEFIGQEDYFKELSAYFKDKVMNREKGVLLVVGEMNTFKKVSMRHMFQELRANKLLENATLEEIDLASYNCNYGYNAFLTDLYEKLSNSSEGIVFTNVNMASDKMLDILTKIYPNSSIELETDYVMNNRFLLETTENVGNTINTIQCNDKFVVFLYDKKNDSDYLEFVENYINNRDKVLYTKNLTKVEKTLIMKKVLFKVLKELEVNYSLDITFRNKESNNLEEDYGILSYIYKFNEDKNFTLMDYTRYKIGNPLKKIIEEEKIKKNSRILLYIENDKIFAKINNEVYELNDYVTPSLEEVKHRLDSIVGIKEFKEHINNIENNFKVQKIRERLSMKTVNTPSNMVFIGNAGTGKTNAARITFDFLNALGVLSRNVFVEVSKADFVSGDASDVEKTTNDIVNSAIGGVLFIDEAYALCESENDNVGRKIIDTLLYGIENNRDNLVVILAGYEKDMERVLNYNQGLKSRFHNIIHFTDYTPEEMYEIAVNIARDKGYYIANNVKNDLIDLFTRNQTIESKGLGNARFVRNVIENAIMDASKKYLLDLERPIDILDRSNFNFNVRVRFDLEEKLKGIVGLGEVKNLLRNQYKLLIAQEKRKSVGVDTKIEQNLNMVFAGNPGTGKTSIARLVAEMLNSMGFLKGGQLVETDRSSFVAENSEETSKKTEAKFKEAIGGILFIDEAYTLANDSLGREVIETLLKLIEDYSKEVIVILAGYSKEMEDFFDVNIGLRSRFPLWTTFEDYRPNELLEIGLRLLKSKGFEISKNAHVELEKSFVDIYENSDAQSGNARMVRNHIENLIRIQSVRVAEEQISAYEMNRIIAEDVEKLIFSENDKSFNLENKLMRISDNDKAKEFLRNQYKLFRINERRKKLGINSDINKYMNIIFTGGIGTGKNIVLNVLTEMLYSIGIVNAKAPLQISKYEIDTAIKSGKTLEDVLNKGIGKVLFIDRTDLFIGGEESNNTIVKLIKFIDKNSNRMIIVLNGEEKTIRDLMKQNPALSYRFPTLLDFDDYTETDLINLALKILKDKGYSMESECEDNIGKIITEFYENKYIIIKNGLMIKQFLDNVIRIQSVRVYDSKIGNNGINTIITDDLIQAKKMFLHKNT
ncbi:AAA family ATPase [Clostridium ganghwense]|uniref:AAA family ATPase n=1 Tax=Clostridium ganghwense TaxID=312089 RepID=A0ABT4CNK6_9CLOT|nr:AAA family ATPase [Clostridium ganghwense]